MGTSALAAGGTPSKVAFQPLYFSFSPPLQSHSNVLLRLLLTQSKCFSRYKYLKVWFSWPCCFSVLLEVWWSQHVNLSVIVFFIFFSDILFSFFPPALGIRLSLSVLVSVFFSPLVSLVVGMFDMRAAVRCLMVMCFVLLAGGCGRGLCAKRLAC